MTLNIAYVFPGQGSQFQGMGKDFYEEFSTSRNVFDLADEILGYKISDICFNSTEEDLKQTIKTQPAIVVTEIAIYEALKSCFNIIPSAVAGHSLGEYPALYSAGVLSFKDVLKAIQKRAEVMNCATSGNMAAIISDRMDIIQNCLDMAQGEGYVSIANYNSPKQIVITGENRAIDKTIELLNKAGIKKVIPLAVSGAFHSALMKDAAQKFKIITKELNFSEAKIPVYTNVDAMPETNPTRFKEKIVTQIYSSVYWTQTIQNMSRQGITTFVEIGPGKVLSGLIKKIIPEAIVYNINDVESLNKTINLIKEL